MPHAGLGLGRCLKWCLAAGSPHSALSQGTLKPPHQYSAHTCHTEDRAVLYARLCLCEECKPRHSKRLKQRPLHAELMSRVAIQSAKVQRANPSLQIVYTSVRLKLGLL